MRISRAVVILSFCVLLSAFVDIRIDCSRTVVVCWNKAESLAQDLAKHLSLMTGADVPVVKAAAVPDSAFVFHVGKKPDGADEAVQPE